MKEIKNTDKIREILIFANQNKALVDGEALDLLEKKENWKQIIESLIKQEELMITRKEIEQEEREHIQTAKKMPREKEETIIKQAVFRPVAKETEANFRIIKELEVTNKSTSQGKIENFYNLFTNKFDFLSSLIRQKHSLNVRPIKAISKIQNKMEIDLVGMVSRKWRTKKNHLAVKIEDMDRQIIVVIGQGDRMLLEEAEKIMPDDVIGVKAVKLSNDLVIARRIVWPDLTIKKTKTADTEVSIAATADIHIGSKLFLENEFNEFIEWLNCTDEKEKTQAGKIKYLFLLGDNVDGIGIYPQQISELNIRDSFEQYKALEELLLKIPEYVEIFVIPGQHDAVRNADPRPAIRKEFFPEMSKMKNFHLLGSPSWVEVEGLKTILFHGNTMHSLFENIPGLTGLQPSKAVVEMLRKRDLMGGFGYGQPFSPENMDYLVLREEPDIALFGDMHRFDYADYRGATIINNSTWQRRTEYQIKKGHLPTPGITAMIELKTRRLSTKNFMKVNEND